MEKRSRLYEVSSKAMPFSWQVKLLTLCVWMSIFLAGHSHGDVAAMASSSGGPKKTILKFKSEEEEAVAVANYTANLSDTILMHKGSFSVVLSGGTLIQSLRKLVEPPYVGSVNWSKWLIFWADERVVPLDDPDSNYKLAYDGFLSKVPIPAGNIYAINYKKSPKYSADDYEARLKQLVKRKIIPLSKSSGFPKFDLMLLGIGPDGHVASLFPSRPQRYEKKRWVTFIKDAPFPPRARITFTFPVINSASEIAMVITGASKADAVKQVLGKYSHPPGVKLLPAAQVSAEGELIWFLDKDAASKL